MTLVAGLGDLRHAPLGIDDVDHACSSMVAIAARIGVVCRTVIEERIWWRRQARMVLADQNPESARMVSSPLAPERRTRAATSSTNLAVPRAVLARPVRWRACST